MMLALGALLLMGFVEPAHGNVRYRSQFGSGFRAKVTVNSQPTTWLGTCFHEKPAILNAGGPVYRGITYMAVLNQRINATDIARANIGGVFLPKNPQIFLHDAEGNLTKDGHRTFGCDAMGRSLIKCEYNYQNRQFGLTLEVRYLYDGMLVIQERDGFNTPHVTYTRVKGSYNFEYERVSKD
jgi:hypothetical protein